MKAMPDNLRVYLSQPHPCPYLPEQTATSLLIDPDLTIDQARLTDFAQAGFRRSGEIVYRPYCSACQACVSVRVPVREFQLTRSQRRIWRRNQGLKVTTGATNFDDTHFAMYQRYQQARHPDSEMSDRDPDKYLRFLINQHCKTLFYEMHLDQQLIGVAVADQLDDGLSAVYTFFEPSHGRRSLGTYAILWLIEHAKRHDLDWVYLGYWIHNCRKMNYKTAFRPIEGFRNGRWQRLPQD